jgi:hypothetical protein
VLCTAVTSCASQRSDRLDAAPGTEALGASGSQHVASRQDDAAPAEVSPEPLPDTAPSGSAGPSEDVRERRRRQHLGCPDRPPTHVPDAPPGMPADCAGVTAMRRDGTIDATVVNGVLAARIHRHLTTTESGNFVFSPLALQVVLAKLMRTLDAPEAERLAREQCLGTPPPSSYEAELEEKIAHFKSLRPKGKQRGIDFDLETRFFGKTVPPELAAFDTDDIDPTTPTGKARVSRWMARTLRTRPKPPPLTSSTVLSSVVAFEGDWRFPFWSTPAKGWFELLSGDRARVSYHDRWDWRIGIVDSLTCDPDEPRLIGLRYVAPELLLVVRPLFGTEAATPSAAMLQYWQASLKSNAAFAMAISLPRLELNSNLDLRCCGLGLLDPNWSFQHTVRMTTRNRGGLAPRPFSMQPYEPGLDTAIVNKPFLFWVRSPDVILLMGRVIDPRQP